MNITEHFSRSEFTLSQTAARQGIVNDPTEPQWLIITGLCEYVLEPTRALMGALTVSSGYRCPELNTVIGGSSRSDHMILGTSCAVDLVHPRLGDLFRMLYWMPWSKLIWEYDRWVHVSWDQNGPPPGRFPWIKTDTRNYENLTYEEMCNLGVDSGRPV